MSDGILLKKGVGFDNTDLTAAPQMVKRGKSFLGVGEKETQIGAMPVIAKIDKKMLVNESYPIAPGYHGGEDLIHQEGVMTEAGRTVNPGAGGITIDVIGKVLTSNTVVMSVQNLSANMIKTGVVVGDVIGTYQGFPDEEM